MLDHVFMDAIGALRDGFVDVRLERLAGDESLQTDLLLGDVTWETSYGLPGEGTPARVRVDLTLAWPTWSQTAYRNWLMDLEYVEPPSVSITLEFRLQTLLEQPTPDEVLDVLPKRGPAMGGKALERSMPVVEKLYGHDSTSESGYSVEYVFLVAYDGSYELDKAVMSDGSELDKHFNAFGGWISSMLVRLTDLDLRYAPPA